MPKIETLYLHGHNLSGRVPNLFTLLPTLEAVTLFPGNEALCGSLPPSNGKLGFVDVNMTAVIGLPACNGSAAMPFVAFGPSQGVVAGRRMQL